MQRLINILDDVRLTMMKYLQLRKKIKNLLQHPQRDVVCKEIKSLVQQKPVQFFRDALTLFGEAKSFESNCIIGNPLFNQLGLHGFRVATAAQLAEKRRQRLALSLDAADVQQFNDQGFILKTNFLPEHQFAQLKQELLGTALETRETLQGDTVTRRMALDGAALQQLPVTKALLSSPQWQALINYVASFKVQPLYYVQVILSHVRQARADPQTHLHSDTFHPSVKAWLFLTDVAVDEGPFVYVPGSHQLNPLRLKWEQKKALSINAKTDAMTRRGSFRVREDELSALGYAQAQALAVKANTLVIADTYGFHARGPSTHAAMRIELWAYARRNPFLPWVGLNPLSLPGLKHQLVPLYWKGLDFLEAKYQRNNPWKKVGKRLAEDPAVIRSK